MLQVVDGMELSSGANVTIDVIHINAVPHPVCEDDSSGMILDGALRAALKAMANVSTPNPATEDTAVGWLLDEVRTDCGQDCSAKHFSTGLHCIFICTQRKRLAFSNSFISKRCNFAACQGHYLTCPSLLGNHLPQVQLQPDALLFYPPCMYLNFYLFKKTLPCMSSHVFQLFSCYPVMH
jgi:hypothetical protein